MTAPLEKMLQQTPVFASLPEKTRKGLIEASVCNQYQKGEWVSWQEDVWPYIFIIETGVITAVKESTAGRSLRVAQFGPGEIFWGLAFFLQDAPTPAGLLAAEDSRLHLWHREMLLPILLQNGRMSWELTLLMVSRMLRASDIVEGLAFQPVSSRLAGWLLESYGDADGAVSRDHTLDEIAALIGSTREMVCRVLYRFAEAGIVEINRTEFKIADTEALIAFQAQSK